MNKNRYFSVCLIAMAILAGCSTMQTHNTALEEARSLTAQARTNPQITSLAPLELQKAVETLDKAEAAMKKGDEVSVNHLSYLTLQQVAIAQETASRKSAEMEIANAGAQRDQVRLEARTAEADNARAQADRAQRTSGLQAEELRSIRAQAVLDQARIEQQQQMLKELNAKQTERGMVITLGDVLFSINRAQLSSSGVYNVRKLGDFLNQYPGHNVLIEGHTDSTGNRSINQPLSEHRADAVRAVLIDMGIKRARIQTRGYAEQYPVASNASTNGRQLNRRVEIILSDENGNVIPR